METIYIKEEAQGETLEVKHFDFSTTKEYETNYWPSEPGPSFSNLISNVRPVNALVAIANDTVKREFSNIIETKDGSGVNIKSDIDIIIFKEETDPEILAVKNFTEVDAEILDVKNFIHVECKPVMVDPGIISSDAEHKKRSSRSELRLIRKDVELGLKGRMFPLAYYDPVITVSQAITAESSLIVDTATPVTRKVPLTEKASAVASLASQLREISSQKVSTTCQYCTYSTSDDSKLKKHIATHKESNMELFSCLLCSFTTIYRYQLKTHTAKHSVELGRQICQYCEYYTNNRHDLKTHVKTHETLETYVCDWCDYSTTHKASFNKHSGKHGRPCPVCSYISFDKADMEQHCKSHLVESLPREVESGKLDIVENGGIVRNASTKRKNPSGGWEGSIECSNCNYKTDSKSDLENHSLVMHSERIVRSFTLCTTFSSTSSNNNGTDSHKEMLYSNVAITGGKVSCRNYRTFLIDSAFESLGKADDAAAEDEMDVVVDNIEAAIIKIRGKLKCAMCSYSTASKVLFLKHKAAHVDKFTCSHCNHHFCNKSNLKKHISAKHRDKTLKTGNTTS